jgi:hypothetical protein
MNYLHMAQELASFENIERAELINEQMDVCRSVSSADLMLVAQKMFQAQNCSQLNYLAKK